MAIDDACRDTCTYNIWLYMHIIYSTIWFSTILWYMTIWSWYWSLQSPQPFWAQVAEILDGRSGLVAAACRMFVVMFVVLMVVIVIIVIQSHRIHGAGIFTYIGIMFNYINGVNVGKYAMTWILWECYTIIKLYIRSCWMQKLDETI